MFSFFRERRLKKHTERAAEHLKKTYREPKPPAPPVRRMPKPKAEPLSPAGGKTRYSSVNYDESLVFFGFYRSCGFPDELAVALEDRTEQTFVEKLREWIAKRRMRDADVYKAAQIDRRLFSRMMSDPQYRPSKDTAAALALALRLTGDDAADLLNRAGYAFSRSIRRDVVLEYCFRKKLYRLADVNILLERLELKPLGR